MHVQLFNYHTAGAQVRSCPASSSVVLSQAEASGNTFSKVICHSWNAGHCIAVNPGAGAIIVLLLVLLHSLLVLARQILRSQNVASAINCLALVVPSSNFELN